MAEATETPQSNPGPAPAPTAAAAADDLVVKIEGLYKTFRSRVTGRGSGLVGRLKAFLGQTRKIEAVRDLSINIRRGEVFGLLGPNGSGKSTTIKMLLGLIAPSAGSIEVLGNQPSAVGIKQRIGFLPEETYLYRFLTADETLDFYGRLFHLPKAERRRRTDDLIERVGLARARTRPLKEYSKGMARRIGLAQALINDPEFVILDEPTTGLDPIGTAEMKQLIEQLKADGKTVLLCSHLLADVEEVCDRVAILCDGDLLAYGELADLLSLGDQLELRVNQTDREFQTRLREFLDKEGVGIAHMGSASDSLARLFLRLIDEKFPYRIPANIRPELLPPDQRADAAK